VSNQINFRRLTAEDVPQIEQVVQSSRHLTARLLNREIGQDIVATHAMELYQSTLSTDEVFGVFDKQTLCAVASFSDLPWDSKHYGKSMASIDYMIHHEGFGKDLTPYLASMLEHIEVIARQRDIQFLMCKSYTDHMPLIHALQQQNFLLVDTLLDYVYNYNYRPIDQIKKPTSRSNAKIREATPDDLEALVAVAEAAFSTHFGRYHSDPRTPSEVATNIYKEWIRSSIAGYADYIFIAELDGEILGYTIWRLPQPYNKSLGQVAHYSIAGIHPRSAGQNLFRLLTYKGMETLADKADYIVGPTHINNYAVQRGYASLEWRIHDARHAFHKWLD